MIVKNALPNNNWGMSLVYAYTHFLTSTGVANSTATSPFFDGSVSVGAIATGLAGDMNALKYLLNGNSISNIFVSSNNWGNLNISYGFINSNKTIPVLSTSKLVVNSTGNHIELNNTNTNGYRTLFSH